ncbi:hypothetical protein ACFSQJ_19815 [Croceitalea marina]|uniref:GOLD domain-containing protein n=1 Tax=Croceitalea marina TaxID=1775166 RepID=A0ABW5N243_9FLAO
MLGVFGCSQEDDYENEDDCFLISGIPIMGIDSPANGRINEIINIEVALSFPSRCASFNGFNDTIDGNIVTIKAKPVELCRTDNTCATIILTIVDYEFIATEPGIYTLNFIDSDDISTVKVTIE